MLPILFILWVMEPWSVNESHGNIWLCEISDYYLPGSNKWHNIIKLCQLLESGQKKSEISQNQILFITIRFFICRGCTETKHDLSYVTDLSWIVLEYCKSSCIRVVENSQKSNESFSDVQSEYIFAREWDPSTLYIWQTSM